MHWWQRVRSPFNPERADENGLVAIGGSLDPDLVVVAYRSGVFSCADLVGLDQNCIGKLGRLLRGTLVSGEFTLFGS